MNEENKTGKGTISFESAALFKQLVEANQLKNLRSVKSSPYPTYIFRASKTVTDIVGAFMAEHDMKCDRSVDTPRDTSWRDFERLVVNAEGKPETIVTRNLRVVKSVVEAGYGCMLKRTLVDQYKKKAFVFYYHEQIAEIKEYEDAKSKERFEKRQADTAASSATIMEENRKSTNTQMSNLFKKIIGGQK